MITLSQPAQINSVLGGNAPVGYDILVLSPFTMQPVEKRITGTLRLSASVNPNMPIIQGNLTIDTATGVLEVRVEQLDFYQRVALTTAAITTVQGWINNAQNAIEGGLLSVGVIAGVQATGA